MSPLQGLVSNSTELIRVMLERAEESGVELRGQTKTHKTVEGGILQTGGTKRKIVTSTLIEVVKGGRGGWGFVHLNCSITIIVLQCEMYADAGFDDILYGFPFIPSHLERVFRLTSRLEMFHMMVTSEEMCQYLASNEPPEGKSWSVFLKVNIIILSSIIVQLLWGIDTD